MLQPGNQKTLLTSSSLEMELMTFEKDEKRRESCTEGFVHIHHAILVHFKIGMDELHICFIFIYRPHILGFTFQYVKFST